MLNDHCTDVKVNWTSLFQVASSAVATAALSLVSRQVVPLLCVGQGTLTLNFIAGAIIVSVVTLLVVKSEGFQNMSFFPRLMPIWMWLKRHYKWCARANAIAFFLPPLLAFPAIVVAGTLLGWYLGDRTVKLLVLLDKLCDDEVSREL